MPHYMVVSHFHIADVKGDKTLDGLTEFQNNVNRKLNEGYTCVGGPQRAEIVRILPGSINSTYISLLWTQGLVKLDDHGTSDSEAKNNSNTNAGGERRQRKTLRKRK